ncbi:Hypothetical predicted protein [Octopus vulgaris]|uniref:Uncharacterized protein n=1 Tax=Octopus vulgaris TaxID=6645 RepID=A0AA36B127_OCTVU|nr:Hypothetical predicted protein [Octopus vulgaris]
MLEKILRNPAKTTSNVEAKAEVLWQRRIKMLSSFITVRGICDIKERCSYCNRSVTEQYSIIIGYISDFPPYLILFAPGRKVKTNTTPKKEEMTMEYQGI